MQDADGRELGPLILKDTERKAPLYDSTDIQCRPDYAAVHRLYCDDTGRTSWPLIELVGEKVSEGNPDPLRKTLPYLHCFMMARPDRNVGLGIRVSKDQVVFVAVFNGIPNARFTEMKWNDTQLPVVMFSFIYRLYKPGSWANDEYTRCVEQHPKLTVSFNLKFETDADPVKCSSFRPVFASNPFYTRTHVFARADSDAFFKGKRFRVVKVQSCKQSRFTEREVYAQIHGDGPVPGVAKPVFHLVLPEQKVDLYPKCEQAMPQQDCSRPKRKRPRPKRNDAATKQDKPTKEQHITLLEEFARSIMEVDTVQELLEILFDVLRRKRLCLA